MGDLEASVVDWFAVKFGASEAGLRQQMEQASVSTREFTSGAGAFLTLSYPANASLQWVRTGSYLDGPEIRSPELSEGALVTLHFTEGVATSVEIWSYAGDYPTGRHPNDFILVEPQINYVHLQREP